MIAHSTAAAAFAGLVLIGLSTAPSLAAPGAGRSTTQVAEATQVSQTAATTTIADSEEDSANCNKQRRRLWIEGEGWIVRRVTICR
jgi:hypothetical protein